MLAEAVRSAKVAESPGSGSGWETPRGAGGERHQEKKFMPRLGGFESTWGPPDAGNIPGPRAPVETW